MQHKSLKGQTVSLSVPQKMNYQRNSKLNELFGNQGEKKL